MSCTGSTKNATGGCNCCSITWKTCWKAFCAPTSPAITSAPVKVKDGSGTVVATGTTDGLGCVTVTLNTAGTYTAYITVSGNDYASPATTLACGDNTTTNVNVGPIPAAATWGFTIRGCGSALLSGATVTIKDAGGTLLASGTTNGSGVWSWTSTTGGTLTWEVSYPGYTTATGTRNGCLSQTITQTLSPAAGYVCCSTRLIPTTLYLLDCNGSLVSSYHDGTDWWFCTFGTHSPASALGANVINCGSLWEPPACSPTGTSGLGYQPPTDLGSHVIAILYKLSCNSGSPQLTQYILWAGVLSYHANYPTDGCCQPPTAAMTWLMAWTGTTDCNDVRTYFTGAGSGFVEGFSDTGTVTAWGPSFAASFDFTGMGTAWTGGAGDPLTGAPPCTSVTIGA